MLTAIQKGLSLVDKAGQTMLVFTVDQKLYKVTIVILFNILMLGGMHTLMAFIHSLCILLASLRIR